MSVLFVCYLHASGQLTIILIPVHPLLTFGTRNWTVREIPPSHEAISIIKPINYKQLFIAIWYIITNFNC